MGNDMHVDGGLSDGEHLTLLGALAEEHGRMNASSILGINYKTLVRNLDSGRVTPRVREALEVYRLRNAAGPELPPAVEKDSALQETSQQLADLVESLSRRVSFLEERAAETEAEGDAKHSGIEGVTGNPRRPEGILTVEQVYGEDWGEVAELVEEWRVLRGTHPDEDDGSFDWAVNEIRRLELEVALLEAHGLTLPPEVIPLSKHRRADAVSWRRKALAATEGRRRSRRLIRILTFGIRR